MTLTRRIKRYLHDLREPVSIDKFYLSYLQKAIPTLLRVTLARRYQA